MAKKLGIAIEERPGIDGNPEINPANPNLPTDQREFFAGENIKIDMEQAAK